MKAAVRERAGGLAQGWWVLTVGALAGLYLVGIYGAATVVSIAGGAGYDLNWVHELFHDVRHAAGFMCH